jgi:ABC-2 type transport system permease protein
MTEMTHALSGYARGYGLMIKWQLLSLRTILPFIVVVQMLIAGGTVYGFSYFYPQIDPLTAQYIVTGATTMTLITLGLVLVPQNAAQMKERGTFDYLWSLPVPRMVFLLADFTVWTLVVAPGVAMALLLGAHKYGFELHVSPMALPAFLLVALSAVAVGMAIAHLSPSPVLTGVITNVIIFSLFLFSPVNFPIERLPAGLEYVHRVLPVTYMADIVRGTLTTGLVDRLAVPFAVVGVWALASFALLFRVFTRRP